MEDENNIKNLIIDFYNDPIFQKLKAYFSKTTLFNILKIERNENRHSAFLAWLLDENGSHGLGEEPLKRFMRLLAKKDDKYNDPFLVGNYHIDNVKVITEKPVKANGHTKAGRIDVYVDFDYYILVDNPDDIKSQHVHVIIENKVYTNEHDDQTKLYLDWARQEYKGKHNQTIIGVFLAPAKLDKCSGDTDDFKYVKITYQDILQDIIEPLLVMEMQQETRVFITDYVINLGQPVRDKEEAESSTNQDTILAISKENESKFIELYKNNQELLDASLYANCYERNAKQLQVVYKDLEKFKAYSLDSLAMLQTFWDSNSDLLRMTLNSALKDEVDEAETDVLNAISVLLKLNESNRDNTKYLVYTSEGTLMNDKNKPSPKSLSSFYIFKAWMHDHKEATLDDIRKAFPVAKCAEHYNDMYQYLFYKYDKKKIIDSSDETNESLPKDKIYAEWAFYKDDNANKYHLKLKDAEKVVCVKKWQKNAFDRLIDYVKKEFNIKVIAQ